MKYMWLIKIKLVILKKNKFTSFCCQFYYFIWSKPCFTGWKTIFINYTLCVCVYAHMHMKSMQKRSSYFEYVENQLCSLDVSWESIRKDLTEPTLLWDLYNWQYNIIEWDFMVCNCNIYHECTFPFFKFHLR